MVHEGCLRVKQTTGVEAVLTPSLAGGGGGGYPLTQICPARPDPTRYLHVANKQR
jgi:hypothetical protein